MAVAGTTKFRGRVHKRQDVIFTECWHTRRTSEDSHAGSETRAHGVAIGDSRSDILVYQMDKVARAQISEEYCRIPPTTTAGWGAADEDWVGFRSRNSLTSGNKLSHICRIERGLWRARHGTINGELGVCSWRRLRVQNDGLGKLDGREICPKPFAAGVCARRGGNEPPMCQW